MSDKMNDEDKKFYERFDGKLDKFRQENEESHKMVNQRIDKVADEVKSFREEFVELKTTFLNFIKNTECQQIAKYKKITIGVVCTGIIWGIITHLGLI